MIGSGEGEGEGGGRWSRGRARGITEEGRERKRKIHKQGAKGGGARLRGKKALVGEKHNQEERRRKGRRWQGEGRSYRWGGGDKGG